MTLISSLDQHDEATDSSMETTRRIPVPHSAWVDVRQALMGHREGGRNGADLSYEDLYDCEPTTWGLGGYIPPCPASQRAEQRERRDLPPVPELPPLPAFVRRHPPRPFSLFDEVAS